jgi:hypothetical protein
MGWRAFTGIIERRSAPVVVAHGTAQLPPKWIRNEQDSSHDVRYPWSINRSNAHVQTCNRCSDSALLAGRSCMTEYLIAARAAIVLWTSLAVMPAEIFFDAIEAELERRGVEP